MIGKKKKKKREREGEREREKVGKGTESRLGISVTRWLDYWFNIWPLKQ